MCKLGEGSCSDGFLLGVMTLLRVAVTKHPLHLTRHKCRLFIIILHVHEDQANPWIIMQKQWISVYN